MKAFTSPISLGLVVLVRVWSIDVAYDSWQDKPIAPAVGVGSPKLSGTLRSMRRPAIYSRGLRTQTRSIQWKQKEARFKRSASQTYIGEQASAQSAKAQTIGMSFRFRFQKLRKPCMVSAPSDPPDDYVSVDKSDDRRRCNRHCERDEKVKQNMVVMFLCMTKRPGCRTAAIV